ncbi:hypothetical protein CRP403_gp2 [Roseobacter phage CRP-403]|uniref:Terminase large subunit n=1 Tax=Roseobacter phage CRP-403 TaxID=3072849 RepID=A0AAX3ZXN8_9CAUD|nr:hypothetical protein CRP403_gp2 [Roseobacter phage CRP-403]
MPTYDITHDQWVTPPTEHLYNLPTDGWIKRYAKPWGPLTPIRYYDYQACDCPHCGMWEEMGIDDSPTRFGLFTPKSEYAYPKFECDTCKRTANYTHGYEVRDYD